MNKNFYLLMMLAILLVTGCTQKQSAVITARGIDSTFVHPNAKNVFDLEALPIVRLTVPVENWNEMLLAYDSIPDVNYWVQGDFEFDKDGVVTSLPNIALRLRGNSSRNRPEGDTGELHNAADPKWHQASFSLNFSKYNKEQTFEGLGKVRLKYIREDPTRIRELYSFVLHQLDYQWTVPLISFCRFYIHVEGDENPAYFGIYKLMENIDEDYITNRKDYFGDKAKGFLWKAGNLADLKDPDPNLMGVDTPEDPKVYDLKTNEKKLADAQDELVSFITAITTKTGDDLKAWAEDIMDVELFMRTYAVNVICGNVDDYWLNSNNYNFYFNKEGKFFFIPNDYDTTLGTYWDIIADPGRQDVLNWGEDNPLVKNLLTIPEFKAYYVKAFHDLAAGPFNVDNSVPRIEGWWNLIRDYLDDDTDDDTPFEDAPAWWSSTNTSYRVVERGDNNYFEVRSANLPALESAE